LADHSGSTKAKARNSMKIRAAFRKRATDTPLLLRNEESLMFNRNHHTKPLITRVVRTVAAIMTFSLFNSSFHTNAQQTTNNPGFTLGFFSIDSKDARACSTANSTLKIEGEALEPGSNNLRKVKLEVTFTNGVVSTKDKDNVLRDVPQNSVYGSFYYLTSHLTGHLTVTMKAKKSKSKDSNSNNEENDDQGSTDSRGKNSYFVDMDLNQIRPIPNDPNPDQVLEASDIPEYIDFAIPCE
jgi:hypothetical protein